MRNWIVAAASAALFASAVPAFSAEQAEGKVQSINASAGTLTLQSGQSFQFADGQALHGFLPGDVVAVTHHGALGLAAFNPNPASPDADVSY